MDGLGPRNGDRRTLRVPVLSRVEGEGALRLVMRGRTVEEAGLDLFEPPRFFEAFLRGREFQEVPDITARICGICPVAYQMSACQALEKALGVGGRIGPILRDLRTLFYCGEWIESHVLHIFLLHLPDFLGVESALAMADQHRPVIQRALRIKKAGNAIVSLLGGRSVHPVGACVGGFHSAPDPRQVAALLPDVRAALDDMADLTLFLAHQIAFPDFDRDYEFVSLCPGGEYPMNVGRIKSNRGLDVEPEAFGDVMEEIHRPHSTALHAILRGRGAYLTGPLARLNLNSERLHRRAAELVPIVCRAVRRDLPWRNPFLSILARALETVHALATAADFMIAYRPPEEVRVPVQPRAGLGAHGTEAPRGLLWHQYRTNGDGSIAMARIVPPTAQNQGVIEEDLREFAPRLADVPDDEATRRCEHLIRNYDPCISCSVHFLRLDRRWIGDQPKRGSRGGRARRTGGAGARDRRSVGRATRRQPARSRRGDPASRRRR